MVDARRRLGVVLGESGVGKSLVLRAAARRLVRNGRAVVSVNALGLSTRELFWQVAAGLGAAPSADSDAALRPGVLFYLLDEVLQGTNSVERGIAVRRGHPDEAYVMEWVDFGPIHLKSEPCQRRP